MSWVGVLRLGILVLLCSVISGASLVSAQVRSSGSYQIQSDSINTGGGFSNSANFQQESTVGEVATGVSTSSSFSLRAGYQQMQTVFLSLTTSAAVSLSPSLPGLTGGESNGSATATVVTDNAAGYQLTIAATNDAAMQRADGVSIADYAPAGFADYIFAIPTASAVFGYSVAGADIVSGFLDNGSVCGVGSGDTALRCWKGLSTTAVTVAQGSNNQPAGTDTVVHFRVGVASGAAVPSGTYVATTTITALPL